MLASPASKVGMDQISFSGLFLAFYAQLPCKKQDRRQDLAVDDLALAGNHQ